MSAYTLGYNDCKAGNPALYTCPEYLEGYGVRYEEEQQATHQVEEQEGELFSN